MLPAMLFALFLLPVAAQERADTAYVFRFAVQNDLFYESYGGNGEELARIEACVERHKKDILAGRAPLHVDGYSTVQPDEAANLAMARMRSNRVKSELITRQGLTEACFVTRNHAGRGDSVTVRITIPCGRGSAAAQEEVRRPAEPERTDAGRRDVPDRIAGERAEAERQAGEQAAREQAARAGEASPAVAEAAKAEPEKPADRAKQADRADRAKQADRAKPAKRADRNPAAGWYAGIRGGMPFGVSALTSFGAERTRAGWSAGLYGGYRFDPVLSLEMQAVWGGVSLSARSCCPDYWLGSDGRLYEGAVAGMAGMAWYDLESRVFMQRYGVQLNANLLGLFDATRGCRWTLELAPHLYAVGTKADFRTLGGHAGAVKGAARWHLGAGGNLQAGYAVTEHLHLGIYTGITYLTGRPLDGTPSHRHKANYIWESGLKLGWSFGPEGKEANR